MTVQLTPAQEERLQQLATLRSLTPDELAQEGIDRFLSYEEDLVAAVQRGREDIAAGRLLEPEEVFARIDRMLQSR
jgi:predicted transcriptional regulator